MELVHYHDLKECIIFNETERLTISKVHPEWGHHMRKSRDMFAN